MTLENSINSLKHLLFLLIFYSLISCGYYSKEFSGSTFGTYYKIKYFSDEKVYVDQKEIDSVFTVFNNSLSTYINDSKISKINSGLDIELDDLFIDVFNKSKIIYEKTNGMFDPSIGLLLEYYGFGPNKKINLIDKKEINSIMQSVGFNKISIVGNNLIKQNPLTKLDFNAIAKGYAVDILSDLLESKRIKNYLIDIGGEIKSNGMNIMNNSPWKVAINNPDLSSQDKFFKIINLKKSALATSGNYRNFRIDPTTGNKYVHTLNPINGKSEQTNILSVSVLAENCFEADAYATAFMASDFENSLRLIEKNNEIDVYIIHVNSENEVVDYYTSGFEKIFN